MPWRRLCVTHRRLDGVVDDLLSTIKRGGERERVLVFEALTLLWVTCGHGEDTQFVRVYDELVPFVKSLAADKDSSTVAAKVGHGLCTPCMLVLGTR